MIEFKGFPKIHRLHRDVIVSEKIDGTNAAIGITEDGLVYAQSRSRIITPDEDNFGFARWVNDKADQLRKLLGPGLHFGEWWGLGIQRGYGQDRKKFSLFNGERFKDNMDELNKFDVYAVPILYAGPFNQMAFANAVEKLRKNGSVAAPGFMQPEGIVIYHTQGRFGLKVTLEKDEQPKGIRNA